MSEENESPQIFRREFLRPRLTGGRFEDGLIPLDALKGLGVLGDLITEVAKWRYRESHPGTARIPKGFASAVDLSLAGVSRGSAVLEISMIEHASSLGLGVAAYYEEALAWTVDAIDEAESGGNPYLPEKGLKLLDRLGRSLGPGEAIEFPGGMGSVVRLTSKQSDPPPLASKSNGATLESVREQTSVRAFVPEVDQQQLTFSLELLDGARVPASVKEADLHTIIEVFNSYRDKDRSPVLVTGFGRTDRHGRLRRFQQVKEITFLDPLDTVSCLYRLRRLEDGWLNGEGLAPDHDSLTWLSQRFEDLYPESLPRPHIYPTPEGGVQAEWSIPPHDVELVIDLYSRRAGWYSFFGEDDEMSERQLDLADSADWHWLTQQIRSYQELNRDLQSGS